LVTEENSAECGVSNYMARKSKELVEEKGVLSLPGPKPGPSLPPETVYTVRTFYESDDISRIMPGKKDFVSVKQGGFCLSKTGGQTSACSKVASSEQPEGSVL